MNSNLVFPGDGNNLYYWSKKWNVDTKRIQDAILETGSLQPQQLITYIRKDSYLYHPLRAVKEAVRHTVNFIF
jgi:hypothetical protein